MGDTPRGYIPLTAPNCMSLGAVGNNPYNLGTLSSTSSLIQWTSVGKHLCSVMLQVLSVRSQSVSLALVCVIEWSVGAFSHLPSLVK